MAGLFGGGSPSPPAVIQTPATVIPVAPKGPQLAPGQRYPGGPIERGGAIIAAPMASVEDEEERRRRNSILQLDVLGGDGSSSGAADAGAGDSSGSADGSAY